MHTQNRFRELTLKAMKTQVRPQRESACIELQPASLARVAALAEVLGMNQGTLVDELVNSALGDAHEGFLSAFASPEERDVTNAKLKARVRVLMRDAPE